MRNIFTNGDFLEAALSLDWTDVNSADLDDLYSVIDSIAAVIQAREKGSPCREDEEKKVEYMLQEANRKIDNLRLKAKSLGADAEEIIAQLEAERDKTFNRAMREISNKGSAHCDLFAFNVATDLSLKRLGGRKEKLTPEKRDAIAAEFIRRRSKQTPDSKEAIYRSIKSKHDIGRRTAIDFLKSRSDCAPYI